ncbi:hypothetical protein ACIVBQ_002430 [Tenacibaculum discolor]
MKRITFLMLLLVLISCSDDNGLSETGVKDKLYVFQKNTDTNTPEIYTKLYGMDSETGKLLNEIGGYERLQARIYYDISYLKDKNEILTRRSVYEGDRGEEIVKFNLNSNQETIISFKNDIYDLTVINNRLFGFIVNTDSADLVEVDEFGNIISVIESFKNLLDAPDNNRTGLENLTFSEEKNMIIIRRRISFYNGDTNKMFTYNIKTKEKRTVDIEDYKSIICGNEGRMFAIKTGMNINNEWYTKLVEFDLYTGKELRDVCLFSSSYNYQELVFLSGSNQVMLKEFSTGIGKVHVDSGEISTIQINYDYNDIVGLNAVRVLGY